MNRKLVFLLLVLGLIPLMIHLTGNNHVYKTLRLTLGKGRLGPSLFEYKDFPGVRVKTASTQPWPLSSQYNESDLSSNEIIQHEQFQSGAFLILSEDSILLEKYWGEFTDTTWSNTFSMTKSYTSMAIGAAILEGQIGSLDDRVGDYLDEFKIGANKDLTLRHLITMSSGMSYSEGYLNPFGFVAKLNYGEDLRSLVLSHSVEGESGKYFEYKGGDTQILAMVLEKATGKSLNQYFEEKIWSKIGASRDAYWTYDRPGGMAKASCCFNSNARDLARLIRVMMNGGRWKEEQLIDSTFAHESLMPAPTLELDGSPNQRYGYQWWMGEFEETPFFYSRGINGQYAVGIPSKDLVVVRLGWKRSSKRKDGHPLDLFDYIKSALRIHGTRA